MANCLVTKLKAEVNNPDLPVLETMQQFTLDAIAASGNATMTDAQKMALNHFFYRIGAIDNNGIYAKLGGLYMPVICGDALAKALVDYTAGGNSKDISAKKVTFQSHGLVAGASGSGLNMILRSNYAGTPDNITVAAMFTESFMAETTAQLSIMGFWAVSGDSANVVNVAQTSDSDYLQLFAKRLTYSQKKAFDGVIGTISGNTHGALFISDESFESNGVTETGSTPAALSYVRLDWGTAVPIGIYAYGAALTSSERDVLARAMKDLVSAFVVSA